MPRFFAVHGGNLNQGELDFLDIELDKDNRFYLDPYAIQIRSDRWSQECGDHIRSFFGEILDALRRDDASRAEKLLSYLHEPNETFLGQSSGKPRGRGVGHHKAQDLLRAISNSHAFHTGLLSDISDAELFVEGVGPDTISDLTTNILRRKLADYTREQCNLHNIDVHLVQYLGEAWDIEQREWVHAPYYLPIYKNQPIILVPKFSVRLHLSMQSQELWNHHMLEFLKLEHIKNNSPLVKVFKKSKEPYVTKKSLIPLHPFIKDDLAEFVRKNPKVLESYKKLKSAKGPISDVEIDENFDEKEFCDLAISKLQEIPFGPKNANEYHELAMGICTFLFYPQLICPVKESEIHEGRKRIDIKFTIANESGFFKRMLDSTQTRAFYTMMECKNYSQDLKNPELDQMSARFGNTRGFFGIILCRKIEDKEKIIKSCRDTAHDGRGYMFFIEDADLIEMLSMVNKNRRNAIDDFLQRKFDQITH